MESELRRGLLAMLVVACGACGAEPAPPQGGAVSLARAASGPAVELSAHVLDFGLAGCGGAAPTDQSVTLTNAGSSALRWTASLDATADFVIVGQAEGVIAAGASAAVTVHARGIPREASAGVPLRGTLLIGTNDPQRAARNVALLVTPRGGALSVRPSDVNFGLWPIGSAPPSIPVTIRNQGNAAITVGAGQPTPGAFALSGLSATSLAPGDAVTGTAAFTPAVTRTSSGRALLDVTGEACAGDAEIKLTGQGSDGELGVSRGALDFGLVGCGTKAKSQQLTVTNAGNSPMPWRAEITGPFTVTPSEGIAFPGTPVTVTVDPAAIPATANTRPNGFAGSLTIRKTNAPAAAFDVSLSMGAYGAVLDMVSDTFDFGKRDLAASAVVRSFALANRGNAPATITMSSPLPQFTVSAPSTLAAGGSAPGTVTFEPKESLGDFDAALAFDTGSTPLCAPPPAPTASARVRAHATGLAVVSDQAACALVSSGRVVCWGASGYAGHDNIASTLTLAPTPIAGIQDATQVVASISGGCALRATGRVTCWGWDHDAERGDGPSTASAWVPTDVQDLTDATSLGAGGHRVCAVRANGDVVCWGTAASGLGDGTFTTSDVPVRVPGISTAVAVAVGSYHGCALLNDGRLRCWGENASGQLGDGTTTPSTTAVDVVGVAGATSVAVAYDRTYAVSAQQMLRWGLSTGPTPTAFLPSLDVTSVVVGSDRSCARSPSGRVRCWGRGYMGDGNAARYSSTDDAVLVSDVTDAAAAAGGYYHLGCVLRDSGGVACWGSNTSGQIGDGTTTERLAPTPALYLE